MRAENKLRGGAGRGALGMWGSKGGEWGYGDVFYVRIVCGLAFTIVPQDVCVMSSMVYCRKS